MELRNELMTLLRADPQELLLMEAAGYLHGFRWLTVEYPDGLADRVVEVLFDVINSVEDMRIIQVPGRLLVAVRNAAAEVVLSDLAARIRAVLPPDSGADAVRDGVR